MGVIGYSYGFYNKISNRPAADPSRPVAMKTLDTVAILMVKLAPGCSKLYNLE